MSRNFFSVPTNDQVDILTKARGQTNAATTLGAPLPQSQKHSSQTGKLNSDGNNNNNNNNSGNSDDALQQVMGLLQQLMDQNQKHSLFSNPTPMAPGTTPVLSATMTMIGTSDTTPTTNTAGQTTGNLIPEVKGVDGKKIITDLLSPPNSTALTHYEYPSPMSDQIYIGGAGDARNKTRLKALNIQFIINLCPGTIPQFFASDFVYKDFNLGDSQLSIIKHYQSFQEYLDNCLNSGMKVLIHDETGAWKAPALVMAYLCQLYSWNLKESYDFCRGRRREIKIPPQVLVALGNWEITNLGISTLTSIVVSKKQKGRFNDGGEVVLDKSLQGFLSNRQVRTMIDDYEDQISNLTMDHRNIYQNHLKLKVQYAQLELNLANGKANSPTVNNMSRYIPEDDIEPFVDYNSQFSKLFHRCNTIFSKFQPNLFQTRTNRTNNSPNSRNSSLKPSSNATIQPPTDISLPLEMVGYYETISSYISSFTSQLIPLTNDDDANQQNSQHQLVPPQHTTTAALTQQGYLTIDLLSTPLHSTNQQNQSQKQRVDKSVGNCFTICLICNTIVPGAVEIIKGQCQCGTKRSEFEKLLQVALKDNNRNQTEIANKITLQTLNFLSTTHPDLFSPQSIFIYSQPSHDMLTTVGSTAQMVTTTSQGNGMNDTTIAQSLTDLTNDIQTQLISQLPVQIPSPKSQSTNITSKINPALAQLTEQCSHDLLKLTTTLSNLYTSLQLQLADQSNIIYNSQVLQRINYIIPIYTLTAAFQSINTAHQSQLVALRTELSSSTLDDSQALVSLRVQLQGKNQDIQQLEGQVRAQTEEIAKLQSSTETLLELRKDNQTLSTKRDGLQVELDQLQAQVLAQTEEIAKLQSSTGTLLELRKDNQALSIQRDGLQVELDQIQAQVVAEQEEMGKKTEQLTFDLIQVKAELDQLKTERLSSENDISQSQLVTQQAQIQLQAMRISQVAGDDDMLQAEAIRQVIGILQTQKIWLGMQLGVTRSTQLTNAYKSSLSHEQLSLELKGVVPSTFIRVLEVISGGVAARCGVRVDDIIVSFNGTLISSVRQIHSIATEITPGDRIAIAVLRPEDGNPNYNTMILSMETRSRFLNSKQLQFLRGIHRGDVKVTADILAQVMELKAQCDAHSSQQNAGNGPMVTHRGSVPDLQMMKSLSSLRDD